MLKALCVVGARPNFMKIAPILAAMRASGEFAPLLVHTGQHYDAQMSDVFFEDLGMPAPDVYLNVGSGSHAQQTAAVMTAFEPVVMEEKPDWIVVVGDVNSTLACALVAAKLHVKVAHVEAGLRSRDRTMPEEINRVLTDQISDLLLTPSTDADENLRREGIPPERIKLVGNVMIDSLFAQLEGARSSNVRARLRVESEDYAVVTLHRPSNVDDEKTLQGIVSALEEVAERLTIVFPIHPRTRESLSRFGLMKRLKENVRLKITEPLGYVDFLQLWSGARIVLTDSGGLQEETTALRIPCLTLRENTERPVTVEMGTNRVVGAKPDAITRAAFDALEDFDRARARTPPLWDGRAAERITNAILEASVSRFQSVRGA